MTFARTIVRLLLWVAVVLLIWILNILRWSQAKRKADPFALAYGDWPAVPDHRLSTGQRSKRGNGSENLERQYSG